MKKILSFYLVSMFVALLGLLTIGIMHSTPASASTIGSSGPDVTSFSGGDLSPGKYIMLGNYPGATAALGIQGLAMVNITKGDILTGFFGTTYTAQMSVSKTTTAGDVAVIGVAWETATAGNPVRIVTQGVCLVNTCVSVTRGTTYGCSGLAGQVTATSSLTAGTYTSLSRSPIAVTSLENRTVAAAAGLFHGYVNIH